MGAISSLVGVSVSTADLILHLLGWLFFLGGAFGNGLTDSGENTSEVVARGIRAVDVEATGSLAILLGKDELLEDVVVWSVDITAIRVLVSSFSTGPIV